MPTQVSDEFRQALLIGVVRSLVPDVSSGGKPDPDALVDSVERLRQNVDKIASYAESICDAVIVREERRLTKDSLSFVEEALKGFSDLSEKKEWRKAGVLLALLRQGIQTSRSAPLQTVNAALLGLMKDTTPGSIGSDQVATIIEVFSNAKKQLEEDLGIA
jgi:hypothetical protein